MLETCLYGHLGHFHQTQSMHASGHEVWWRWYHRSYEELLHKLEKKEAEEHTNRRSRKESLVSQVWCSSVQGPMVRGSGCGVAGLLCSVHRQVWAWTAAVLQ